MKDFAADTNYVNGWHLSCIAAGMTLQCKSTLGVALAALMVACGGVGSATAGAPDLDGSTDVPSGDDPGVVELRDRVS